MSPNVILNSTVLALCLASGWAEELKVRDFSLRLETLPTDFTYDVTSAGGSRHGDDQFRSNIGLAAGWRYSLAGRGQAVGPLVGFDVAASDARGAGIRENSAELRGLGGVGWQAQPHLTLLAQCAVGIGYGALHIDQADGPSTGDIGSLTIGSAVWWQTGARTRLTFDAGWRTGFGNFHNGPVTIDTTQSGLTASIGFTVSFVPQAKPVRRSSLPRW